jgi:transcriptional regulator with XRE-family HTH domain
MTKKFGDYIRDLRRQAGKTLQEIADALGVSAVYISEVERGKRPPFVTEKIKLLAPILGVDSSKLILRAWVERRTIDLDPSMSSRKQLELLSGFARGGLSEDQIDDILKIMKRSKKEGE